MTASSDWLSCDLHLSAATDGRIEQTAGGRSRRLPDIRWR